MISFSEFYSQVNSTLFKSEVDKIVKGIEALGFRKHQNGVMIDTETRENATVTLLKYPDNAPKYWDQKMRPEDIEKRVAEFENLEDKISDKLNIKLKRESSTNRSGVYEQRYTGKTKTNIKCDIRLKYDSKSTITRGRFEVKIDFTGRNISSGKSKSDGGDYEDGYNVGTILVTQYKANRWKMASFHQITKRVGDVIYCRELKVYDLAGKEIEPIIMDKYTGNVTTKKGKFLGSKIITATLPDPVFTMGTPAEIYDNQKIKFGSAY